MIKFLFGEYVRNVWYNVVSVLMITATVIISTIYISNITAQTKLYRLVSQYLNEDSIIMHHEAEGFDSGTLTKLEKTLMTKCFLCVSNDIQIGKCHVYNDEIMSVMPPRLAKGRQIGSADKNDDRIEVLISENVKSYGVGDEITLKYYYLDWENMVEIPVDIKCVIVGVIAEGQKMCISSGKGGIEAGYEDLYLTYSHEQTRETLILTTEEQLSKLDLELNYIYENVIFKFEEDITEEERNANQLKVTEYELEKRGTTTASGLQSPSRLTEMMEVNHRNIMLKYVPLTIGMIILVTVCIVGIISIKTARSMRYYSTLYICGMNPGKALILSGGEMLINCVLATVLGISLMTIQNKMEIVDTINCELGTTQILTISALSMVMILMSMLVTRTVMKERSPMDILKDTTF